MENNGKVVSMNGKTKATNTGIGITKMPEGTEKLMPKANRKALIQMNTDQFLLILKSDGHRTAMRQHIADKLKAVRPFQVYVVEFDPTHEFLETAVPFKSAKSEVKFLVVVGVFPDKMNSRYEDERIRDQHYFNHPQDPNKNRVIRKHYINYYMAFAYNSKYLTEDKAMKKAWAEVKATITAGKQMAQQINVDAKAQKN